MAVEWKAFGIAKTDAQIQSRNIDTFLIHYKSFCQSQCFI